uniref:Uncharacterized protein n=1 Tax=Nelumbo nucifera TaxID=4432 RepID=A0A822Y017_NELNU|nr:TPA_asm: hypothetical protein HUJ06_025849 [Nelumbo nucifera]
MFYLSMSYFVRIQNHKTTMSAYLRVNILGAHILNKRNFLEENILKHIIICISKGSENLLSSLNANTFLRNTDIIP